MPTRNVMKSAGEDRAQLAQVDGPIGRWSRMSHPERDPTIFSAWRRLFRSENHQATSRGADEWNCRADGRKSTPKVRGAKKGRYAFKHIAPIRSRRESAGGYFARRARSSSGKLPLSVNNPAVRSHASLAARRALFQSRPVLE